MVLFLFFAQIWWTMMIPFHLGVSYPLNSYRWSKITLTTCIQEDIQDLFCIGLPPDAEIRKVSETFLGHIINILPTIRLLWYMSS